MFVCVRVCVCVCVCAKNLVAQQNKEIQKTRFVDVDKDGVCLCVRVCVCVCMFVCV